MASANMIIKNAYKLNYPGIHIEDIVFTEDENHHLCTKIYVNLSEAHACRCPLCKQEGKSDCCCPTYDHRGERYSAPDIRDKEYRKWTDVMVHGQKVYIYAPTRRITCKVHGVKTASVPWAEPSSNFTKRFEIKATLTVLKMPKLATSEVMGCSWDAINKIFQRVHTRVEADIHRYDNLVNIAVDETSYHKGHRYVTVVINQDTNDVIWVHEGHDIKTFSKFFEALTQEQRASIKTVAGDGAKWIDACVEKYVPHAKRCVDKFHVMQWVIDAIDRIRRAHCRKLKRDIQKLTQQIDKKKAENLPISDDEQQLAEMESKFKQIKSTTYALGKNSEKLTDNQQSQLESIKQNDPVLYEAYTLKEELRSALNLANAEEAQKALEEFIEHATNSQSTEMSELGQKIQRRKEGILHMIRTGKTSAKSEAMNNKIKLIIRLAYGYRSLQNFKEMILVSCSSKIPAKLQQLRKDIEQCS